MSRTSVFRNRAALFCLGTLVAAPGHAAPCMVNGEPCEQRIAELEQRLARVETELARLEASPAAEQPPAAFVPNVKATPAASAPNPHFEMPPELLPQIGKIGAEVGLLLSAGTSPFRLNSGSFAGGFIDLPLHAGPRWLPGTLAYEISVGMSQSHTTFPVTSNVAQVANLSLLTSLFPQNAAKNISDALTGTGSAPFPVNTLAQTRLRLLQVIPFEFKYTTTAFDRWRLRPYGLLGFGTYVTIHSQNPADTSSPTYGVRPNADLPPAILASINQIFGGQAPFGGPLVAGQISQAPELEARGLPGGHGNIDFGWQSGGGVEFRLTPSFSLGFDARYNRIAGTYGNFVTYGTRIGFHW